LLICHRAITIGGLFPVPAKQTVRLQKLNEKRESEANRPSLSTCINPNDRQARDDFSLNCKGSFTERSIPLPLHASPRSFVGRAFFFRSISNFAIKGAKHSRTRLLPVTAIIASAVARRFKVTAVQHQDAHVRDSRSSCRCSIGKISADNIHPPYRRERYNSCARTEKFPFPLAFALLFQSRGDPSAHLVILVLSNGVECHLRTAY